MERQLERRRESEPVQAIRTVEELREHYDEERHKLAHCQYQTVNPFIVRAWRIEPLITARQPLGRR